MAVTSGVLINAATGVLNFSPGSNQGIRVLDAELFNQGTVNVERNTTFAKSVTNEGVFDIAAEIDRIDERFGADLQSSSGRSVD